MKNYIAAVVFLFVGYSAACFGDVITNSPLSIRGQHSQAGFSPNQNNQYGNNVADYRTQNFGPVYVGYKAVANNSSLQAKQEALLVAQNPTTLQVTGLRWVSWFGDKVPFMDIELTNVSDLPALDVHVSLLDKNSGSTFKSLKPYKLNESYIHKIMKGTPVGIGAKSKFEWPVASIDDVQSIVQSDCITGAGLGFQPLITSVDMDGPQGIFLSQETPLLFKISYKTIFGKQMSIMITGIVDSANRKSDYMVPRGSSKKVPLKCVGDPEWNRSTRGDS